MTICIYLSDTWLPWKYVGSCVPINNISYNYTVFHFPLLHFNNVITRVKKKKKKKKRSSFERNLIPETDRETAIKIRNSLFYLRIYNFGCCYYYIKSDRIKKELGNSGECTSTQFAISCTS